MVRIVQTSQSPRAPPTLLVTVARCDGGEKRRERVNGERKKGCLVEEGTALLNRQTYLTHENDENGREGHATATAACFMEPSGATLK